jgi:hypothetical protein
LVPNPFCGTIQDSVDEVTMESISEGTVHLLVKKLPESVAIPLFGFLGAPLHKLIRGDGLPILHPLRIVVWVAQRGILDSLGHSSLHDLQCVRKLASHVPNKGWL